MGVGEVVVGVNPLTDVSDRAEPADGVDDRFQLFYEERYESTVRLARLLIGDSHAAEDIAQDAFVKVYRYAASTRTPIANPAALLRTTTVNLCRTWHTQQRRTKLRMTRNPVDAEHGALHRGPTAAPGNPGQTSVNGAFWPSI